MYSIRSFALLVVVRCLGVGAGSCAWAQQTLGGVTGTVTDPTGSVVQGAAVTAVAQGTHLTRAAATNAQGSYALPDLPIGTYVVTVEHAGFTTQRYPSITVQADRTVTLSAQLSLGQAKTEEVTVDANPLMNAIDTTNGYILEKAQIDNVPLPTGSFTGLALLSPGVSAELPGGTGANSGLGNAPIWANGQRDTSNSFMLNGVDASNLFNGKSTSQVSSARVVNETGIGNSGTGGVEQTSASVYLAIGQALPTPAPETVEEVRVNASMYDAQQGSNSGAHIDLSTVSGTNAYHGTAYLHRGTDWLNAAPFFYKQDTAIPASMKVPQLHRYTAGASLGGPLVKDKLFGYAAYQHIHVGDQEIGASHLAVPPGLTDDRSAAALASVANADFGTHLTAASISPIALALMTAKINGQYMVPSATGALTGNVGTNAFIPGTAYFASDQAVANLDWNASAKDTLSAKYYFQHDPLVAPFAYSNVPGFSQSLDTGSQVFSLNNSTLLKPNLSVVQVLGFIREKAFGVNQQPFTPQSVGITGTFGSTYFPGITIVDAVGNGNAGGQNPNFYYDDMLNIGPSAFTQSPFTGMFQNRLMPSADATWTLGRHTVQFGGSYSYTQLNVRDQRTGKGMISTADFPGFLQGNISYQNNHFTTTTFLVGDANRYYRANQVGTYLQDKFQVRPNLTLSAGVRYDWDGGLTEKNGNIFNFDPASYQFNSTCLDDASGAFTSAQCYTANGFVIAGNNAQATPGASKTTLTGRQWGIGPRVGAAWQPAAMHGRMVVRTGAGIYYDRGELFSYLSPGYANGEVTGGPFGVNQTPPFVNAVQCDPNAPGTPTVASACAGPINLQNPWGTSAPNQPTGRAADITNYMPTPYQIANGAQIFTFANYNAKNKLPYTINYTLDVQYQPRNNLLVEFGYVGNVGRHQVIPVPFNQAGVASASHPIHEQIYSYGYSVQQAGHPFCYYNCAPAALPAAPAGVKAPTLGAANYLYTNEGGNIDLRAPFLGYSAESETFLAEGVSAYNALQMHVEQRLTHGLQAGMSYTYSHALDEQSALGLFYNGNNPLNLRDGYASADFDRTHVVSLTLLYRLPGVAAASSLMSKVLNGWSISTLTILQSGQPFSVIDYSGGVGSLYYGVADGITNPIVPLVNCTPQQARTGKSGAFGDYALKANCFGIPHIAAGTLGTPANDPYETGFTTGQRNIFRQSPQKRADASLIKEVRLTERYSVKYTLDVYNLTNSASFDIPNDNIDQNGGFDPTPSLDQTPDAGGAHSFFNTPNDLGAVHHTIGSPRQVQMSLHLNY